MTVCGFVGTFDDDVSDPIRGNGKSMAMTYYARVMKEKHGYEVYTNYKTTFSDYMSVDEMIQLFLDRGKTFHHVVFCIDEIGEYVDSHGGANNKQIKAFMSMVKQLRKRWSHLYWTNQRYLDVAKQIRIQTEEIYRPVKTHPDRRRCPRDICPNAHLIWVFRVRPPHPKPDVVLNARVVGELYDTEEIILDQIHVHESMTNAKKDRSIPA